MAVIKLDKNGNAVGKSGADTINGNNKTNICCFHRELGFDQAHAGP